MTAQTTAQSTRSAFCETTAELSSPVCASAGLSMTSFTTSCACLEASGRTESEDLTSLSATPETQPSSTSECSGRERFEALSKKEQETILGKHRNYNVSDGLDWWDGVYENFIEDMKEIGIVVASRPESTLRGTYARPAIYFSGFWSQGDGACFEGRVDDWTTFIKAAFPNDTEEYLPLWTESEAGSPSLHWTHSGRYGHENSCTFHSDFDINNEFDPEKKPLRYAVREAIVKYAEILAKKMFEETEEFIKGKMKELYKALEKEHDYLTSNNAVLDAIEDQLNELIDAHEADAADE